MGAVFFLLPSELVCSGRMGLALLPGSWGEHMAPAGFLLKRPWKRSSPSEVDIAKSDKILELLVAFFTTCRDSLSENATNKERKAEKEKERFSISSESMQATMPKAGTPELPS